jgi:transcriptional regulator with XRE-family HTH domain
MLIDIKTVGLQIKQSRLLAGISQAELARLADVSRATINGIENNSIKEIGVNRLNRVVAASQSFTRVRNNLTEPSRKSSRLNLSFPYDWSNSAMSDTLLIDKVVERGLFEDMAKIAVRYGTEPLRRAVTAFASKNLASAPSLNRMLGNIEKALHARA